MVVLQGHKYHEVGIIGDHLRACLPGLPHSQWGSERADVCEELSVGPGLSF